MRPALVYAGGGATAGRMSRPWSIRRYPGSTPDPILGACSVVPDQHLERGGHVGPVQADGDQPGVLGDAPHHGGIEFRAHPGLAR